jgi:hypothetical protein
MLSVVAPTKCQITIATIGNYTPRNVYQIFPRSSSKSKSVFEKKSRWGYVFEDFKVKRRKPIFHR